VTISALNVPQTKPAKRRLSVALMKIWKKARGAKASLTRPDFARDFGRFCSKATLKRRKRTKGNQAIFNGPKITKNQGL
jgi:hypothetical protein